MARHYDSASLVTISILRLLSFRLPRQYPISFPVPTLRESGRTFIQFN